MSAEDDELWCVLAHSLLNSVVAIRNSAELLLDRGEAIADDTRDEVLGLLSEQATHVSGALQDLVALGRPELVQALDELGPS